MIKVSRLTRHFGHIVAVDDVSFEVKKGDVLGFLGPNGAGKTTTMRLITGYFEPSDGKISIDGIDVQQNPEKAKSMIGYLPENAPVYRDMHVLGFLRFIAEIRGISSAKAKDAVDRVVSICHLEKVLYQSIDTLSKGYIRRTALAQAIIHDPPVLILDEPTDGLDPNQKHEVRTLINKMSSDKAIIISTHILEEVEACCSRTIIIANGRIVANGTPAELKTMADSANTIVLGIKGVQKENILGTIRELENVKLVRELDAGERVNPESVRLRIYPANKTAYELTPELLSFLKAKNWEICDLFVDTGRLDEVFRKITITD